ncbi:cell wall surface anchor family protein [Streptococcus pyogenes]|uniref:Cell wall surface anchor family protein n=1 Tax=Streptococcus pyogenes TaxID=1314 RepID=A0A8B6IZM2_STRPY|nr:isopeptide-forming domain-containing fimbrial protein [Streptococcus pyogenes]VHA84539.1 cell wall surface anchor family protein [Streptococcus pyogenes]VHB73430.1 cell wall surface anchor family protein [Streptococcus pyogenes]VHC79779.1 cell wall surface anchor family protein [Streptococcus pyogenes]VHD11163.1 cell wall surface anchor family protein [Streptococcus pyogenes]VHD25154.1 cell wall surface anchor family protein [Streptococcus pyogenes]
MKRLTKLFAVFTAILMTVTVLLPVLTVSAVESEQTTKSVTVHKLLAVNGNMESIAQELKNRNYDGRAVEILPENAKEIAGVMFVWTDKNRDVIDANGKPVGVQLTESGKLPAGTKKLPTNALASETLVTGAKFDTAGLSRGEYKIYEIHSLSSYKDEQGNVLSDSLAVPISISLPLNDVIDAHVYPKNIQSKPEIDKNFAKSSELIAPDGKTIPGGADYLNYQVQKAMATAELGKVVPYEVKTKIPANAKYAKLVWTDTMSNGLTFDMNLKVSGATLLKEDYDVVQDDRGFTLTLNSKGLAKVEKQAETSEQEITLAYSATVNSSVVVDTPEKNNISLDYGNRPGKENTPTSVTPNIKELLVTKNWAGGVVPNDINVVYTLLDETTPVASVLMDGKKEKGTINLGSGISFEITDKYSGKFTGLDSNKTYKFIERVSGYAPEYTVSDSSMSVKNTKDTDNPTPLNPTEPTIVNGGKKFVKVDETSSARLEGAEFKIQNADGQYLIEIIQNQATKDAYDRAESDYKAEVAKAQISSEGVMTGTTQEAIELKKAIRDKAYRDLNTKYTWGDVEKAKVFTSNKLGQFEVTGLAYASGYKVIETKAPKGYALPSNTTVASFDVAKGSYSKGDIAYSVGKETDAKRVNNKKVTIPQTGGIGTVIFAVVGAALMAAAFVAYRKSNKEVV